MRMSPVPAPSATICCGKLPLSSDALRGGQPEEDSMRRRITAPLCNIRSSWIIIPRKRGAR
jgi:hypothetical protein